MGTIAQKGEYLEETKGLIAESINNLGGSITSETTFREYAQELDTIYSNLPKVTGENTEVILTPTLKGKLGIVEKGNSTQESTTGKNLFNLSDLSSGCISDKTSTGFKFTRTNYDRFSNTIQLPKTIPSGTTIHSSADITNSTFAGAIQLQFGSDSSFSSQITSLFNANKTLNIDVNYVRIYVGSSEAVNTSCIINNLQIEIGTAKTDYEQYTGGQTAPNPSYPFPIKSVTGENNVAVSNKNLLLNGTKFTPTMLGWADNNGNFINSYEQLISSSNYVDLKGGQAYTFKIDNYANIKGMQLVYLSGTTIQTFVNANVDTNAHTFTPQTNTRVWARYNINAINTETYINAQLELGSTATSYVEHAEQTLPLNLGNIELNGINNYNDLIFKAVNGNSFYDSLTSEQKALLTYGKWYKHEVIEEKDKDYLVSQLGQVDIITNYVRIRPYLNVACITTPTGLCSHLKYEASYSGQSNHFYAQGNFSYLIVDKTLLPTTDLAGAKTYLNTLTGLKILYPKATSTDIEITDTNLINQLEDIDKMQGYNGTTIITSTFDSNNAQMIISASGLKGE